MGAHGRLRLRREAVARGEVLDGLTRTAVGQPLTHGGGGGDDAVGVAVEVAQQRQCREGLEIRR